MYTVLFFNVKVVYEDEETIKAMSEFATIEEQLNGVEKYAVYFLEEETAEIAAEQLRVAEVLFALLHSPYVLLQFVL